MVPAAATPATPVPPHLPHPLTPSSPDLATALDTALAGLFTTARELWVPPVVPVADASTLPAATFVAVHRDRSTPLLLTGAVDGWAAYGGGGGNAERGAGWDAARLSARAGDVPVTVNCTPDGRADALVDGRLALPAEVATTLGGFLAPFLDGRAPAGGVAEGSSSGSGSANGGGGGDGGGGVGGTAAAAAAPSLPGVAYLSHQNDNLRLQLPGLLPDTCPWPPACLASAFPDPPDAVNLWLGTAASATSMHADPYDNCYVVLRGAKHFTLLPPCDAPWLAERFVPVARWHWEKEEEEEAAAGDGTCNDDGDGLNDGDGREGEGEARPRGTVAAGVAAAAAHRWVLRDEPGAPPVPWVTVDVDAPGGEAAALPWLADGSDDEGGGKGEDPAAADRGPVARRGGRPGTALRVTVRAGEVLFLPALWYHAVTQSGEAGGDRGGGGGGGGDRAGGRDDCSLWAKRTGREERAADEATATNGDLVVAVNFWYDMDWSTPAAAYARFVRDLGRARTVAAAAAATATETTTMAMATAASGRDAAEGRASAAERQAPAALAASGNG